MVLECLKCSVKPHSILETKQAHFMIATCKEIMESTRPNDYDHTALNILEPLLLQMSNLFNETCS